MEQDIRILVVDDEERIRTLVKMYLKNEGYQIDEAKDGDEALEKLKNINYNLVVLDLMLPGTDGLAVCGKVRAFSDVPIIMLTAKGDEVDRLVGFKIGADDYVIKPFSPRELTYRVKALLKRTEGKMREKEVQKLQFPGLIIDLDAHVKNLREKIEKSFNKKYIHTIWGVGYKFEVVAL